MVVIVNAFLAVDKKEFVYSVNGLRVHGSAGQALYRCWTDVGQKCREPPERGFCTSSPVDMQAVFHSRAVFQGVFTVQLAVFACLYAGRHLVGQAAIDVPDATRASCSFCRQNGSRAELALASEVQLACHSSFFCKTKAFAWRTPCRESGGAMPKPKPLRFSLFS